MSCDACSLLDCKSLPHLLVVFGRCAVILCCGGFGGLVYALSLLLEGGKNSRGGWEAAQGSALWRFLAGNAAIGAGGAFAAVFGVLTLSRSVGTDKGASAEDNLLQVSIYLVALAVVGGFGGSPLLRSVVTSLRQTITAEEKRNLKKLPEAVEEAQHAKEEAQQAIVSSGKTLEIILAMSYVDDIESCRERGEGISEGTRSDASESMKRLEGYVASSATERKLNIVLANLKFELGHHEDATRQLQSFLAMRRAAKIVEDDTDATAWFNLACFYTLMAKHSKAQRVNEYFAWALEGLGHSLRIAKAGGPTPLKLRLSRVEDDKDLSHLRERLEGGYRTLLADYND